MDYWVLLREEVHGPYDLEKIREMVLSGELVPHDRMTTNPNKIDWVLLSSLPELVTAPVKVSDVPLEERNSSMPFEYRRTCNRCGKVWHSLASRERQIEADERRNAWTQGAGAMSCGMCGATGLNTASQASRNIEAGRSELHRLRSCPDCLSSHYDQEIRVLKYDRLK